MKKDSKEKVTKSLYRTLGLVDKYARELTAIDYDCFFVLHASLRGMIRAIGEAEVKQ